MKNIKSIWQEGKYYDAWILVHFLAGVVIGFGMLVLNIQVFNAYILIFIALMFWETFEIITNIKEHGENRLLDIVIGILGFVLSFSISPMFLYDFFIPFIFSVFLFGIFCIIGWIKYAKYGR